MKTPRGWKGYNTDGFGLETAIKKAFGREMKGSNVVVIGAGGAARAAAFHALFAGCKSLSLVNRSPQRLDKLSSDIRAAGFDCQVRLASENLDIPDSPIIINATSLGLKEGDPPCADFSAYPTKLFAYEEMAMAGQSLLSCQLEGDCLLIVGPEGGFAKEEASYLLENGFAPISLGKRILRAETAAIFGCSVLIARSGS